MRAIFNFLCLTLCSLLAHGQPLPTTGDYAHYSFALDTNAQLQVGPVAEQVQSNEYSIQVNGHDLHQGVTLHTTKAEALFLLTPLGSKQQSPLDVELLQLRYKNQQGHPQIARRVSQQLLAQTGVLDNSMALQTTADSHPGAMLLSTSQPLPADASYRITVKEKGSAYILNLSVDNQNLLAQQRILARASLEKLGQSLQIQRAEATLVAPDGELLPASVKISRSGDMYIRASAPQKILSPKQGLYEIRLQSVAQEDQATIPRDAKLAVALTNKTATLADVFLLQEKILYAKVGLLAEQDSRFEIRAMLYGTNADGQLVPVMESHAAQTLTAGADSILVPFEQAILDKAGVTAPFKLASVKLFDQHQLGLLDTKLDAATLN
ncbi:hypothetical protein GCM10009092_02680 [Bowmanella denitrificans]|uniref:DUF4785 domain-containing protein n=1 Tax=Bowmanella denitrificans TaxID=366582 RepID=A0ABP3GBP3_9ALTE